MQAPAVLASNFQGTARRSHHRKQCSRWVQSKAARTAGSCRSSRHMQLSRVPANLKARGALQLPGGRPPSLYSRGDATNGCSALTSLPSSQFIKPPFTPNYCRPPSDKHQTRSLPSIHQLSSVRKYPFLRQHSFPSIDLPSIYSARQLNGRTARRSRWLL